MSLFGLHFNPEEGENIFLRKVGSLLNGLHGVTSYISST
jgi:hypothetical protein